MTSRLSPVRTPVLASVLTPGDLPLAELSSARLDGELYPLGDFWCPIDEPESPLVRARVAALLVPSRAIAERMTAAWIYGVCPEPARHQFCVDLGARTHVPPSPRLRLREVRCTAEDTRTIAGLRVTTPLRTVVDLARSPGPVAPGQDAAGQAGPARDALGQNAAVQNAADQDVLGLAPLLAALLRFGGFADTRAAERLCRRHNLPHKTIALARLAGAQALLERPL